MLADVYTAGGEVLMGTLRWEKEDAERAKLDQRRTEYDLKHSAMELAEADTRARIRALELDLERQRIELQAYSQGNEAREVSSTDRENELRRIRSGDPNVDPTEIQPGAGNGSRGPAHPDNKNTKGASDAR
jgi:circadian clock protein KaiC